jgi:hypothetical protein
LESKGIDIILGMD